MEREPGASVWKLFGAVLPNALDVLAPESLAPAYVACALETLAIHVYQARTNDEMPCECLQNLALVDLRWILELGYRGRGPAASGFSRVANYLVACPSWTKLN